MFDGRRVMRWIAAAALVALAGCSIVNPPPKRPCRAGAHAVQPTAPPPPAPLRATPAPEPVAADGLGHVALLMADLRKAIERGNLFA